MLYEIKNAKKFDNGIPIKWFTDKYFDLTVWFSDDMEIISFQLSYDIYKNPHALTWKKDRGFSHNFIDNGENPGRFKQSPILMPDGVFPGEDIAERFKKESIEIDSDISSFVYEKLLSYQE